MQEVQDGTLATDGLENDQLPDGPTEDAPIEERSLMDRLRNQRQQLQSEHRMYRNVPGYNREMVIEFKPIDGATIERITQSAQKKKGRVALYASLGTIAAACVGIWVRLDPETDAEPPDGLIPFGKVFGIPNWEEVPVVFDKRLADAMQFDPGSPPSALQIVREFYGRQDPAIMSESDKLTRWMTNVTEEVDENFLGE